MSALFCLERWPLGWVISGPGGCAPVDVLGRFGSVFGDTAVIDPGICSHLRTTSNPDAVFVIAEAAEADKWRAEIEAGLALDWRTDPQRAWLIGTDTGSSSKAIFRVLGEERLRYHCNERGVRGDTPRDSADLGRCLRLLAKFPEWEARLSEVAAAYPETKWPIIVSRWAELKAAQPKQQSAILREIGA